LTVQVTVWGAGAIGGVVGAWLVRNGVDVLFVDQDAAHVEAMNRNGLFVDGIRGEFRVPVKAVVPDDVRGPLGTVLLAVKCLHTETAVRQMMPHLTPESAVVSLQNGLNEELIAELIGPERTVGCFVNFGADWQAPGHIRHGGEHPLYIGELDGRRTGRVEALQRLLSGFCETIVTDNIWGYLWSKLAYASILFATALVDAHVYEVVADPLARPVLAGLAREVLVVARAYGIRPERLVEFWPDEFEAGDYDRAFARIAAHYRSQIKTKTGIWRDLAVRHRRTEVDCQVGVAIEKGRAVGLDLPLNRQLQALIHELEAGTRQMSWDNFRAFNPNS
jgi:2-dehydropantoate 2-reductase